jgi:hypothetical protein
MLNVGNRRREAEQRGPAVSMLSMYREPPLVDVSLEDFEGFAIDRLHGARPIARACSARYGSLLTHGVGAGAVLKAVENYRLRSVTMKDREARLEKTINRHLPLRSAAPMKTKKAEAEAEAVRAR